MKQARSRWQKMREKARERSAGRRPLSQGKKTSWERLNQADILALAICEFLERVVLPKHNPEDAVTELLVAAIHDWKEYIRDGN